MLRSPFTQLGSLIVLFPLAAALLGAGCSGSGPADSDGSCSPGQLGCACNDGMCDPGLVCTGTCEAPDGTGGGPTDGSGGTPGATGGAGTGGTDDSSCTGTPTGSCDDPLCDTFPGCTETESSACGGIESPCSMFDGDMAACGDQWGCEPSVNGLCSGYDDPECEWAQTAGQCNTLGCYWTGADCIGVLYEPPNCAGISAENTCVANPACYWTESETEYCEGRATACDAMANYRCELQAGCEVSPATCSGTATPCAELNGSAECYSQPGCLWNGQSRQDTPTGSAVTLPDFAFLEATIGRAIEEELDYLHVDFSITNRGPRAGTPHAVHIVLSEDDQYDAAEDSVIYEIAADTEMAQFGFLPLWWEGYLPMLDISADHADGTYTVFIVIDPEDETDEAEDANNVWAQPEVFIGPTTFDLVLTGASHDASGTVAPEDDLIVSLDVENDSTTDVGTVPVRVVLSTDEDLDASDIDVACEPTLTLDLPSGASDSFDLDCVLPRARGDYFVLVELDPDDTLADANRADNVLSAGELTIDAPAPDLIVSAIDPQSPTYPWAATATFTATIQNVGADPAPATTITFVLSDDVTIGSDLFVCTRSVAAIPAEDELAFEDDCVLPSDAIGTYNLLAIVDPDDDIYEDDDSNNESGAVNLTVNQPNFNLEAIYLQIPDFSSVAPGDQLVLGFRVDNPGTAEIPGYRIEFYASTDQAVTTDDELFCYSDRAALPGGSSLEVQISCATPSLAPGQYYLAAFFDPEDEVPETDEGDNVALADTSDPLTVEAP